MTTNIIRIEDNKIISEPTNYQGFTYNLITRECVPTGNRTPLKWDTLKNIFPGIVKDSSFLDLGANFGFFCFKALECGCDNTIGIEANKDYFEPVNVVLKSEGVKNFKWLYGRFPQVSDNADVVMALSLVHHLFSKMPLHDIIYHIKSCSNRFVIIEWIDRDDDSVKKYKYDKRFPEYNKTEFENILYQNFKSVENIGEGHHSTRTIYLLTV